MRRFVATMTLLLLQAFAAVPHAYAALERVGPVDLVHGFPQWYQDSTGLILEFCSPTTQAELGDPATGTGGWCLLLPGDTTVVPPVPPDVPIDPATGLPAIPEVFPGLFAEEHFYWAGGADVKTVAYPTFDGLLVLGLEAAFGLGAPAAGDGVVFGRIRIRLKDVPFDGDYTVYTPYGVFVLPGLVANSGRTSFTQDIGLNCPPGAFDCALAAPMGPFLVPSNTPGGLELPPYPDVALGQDLFAPDRAAATPDPGTGRKYLADPVRLGPVTGSPLPPFMSALDGVLRDHNIFRVEGPNGFAVETTLFNLMGRVYAGAVPGRVTLDRASYARPVAGSPTGNKVDVYATALPTIQGRMPGGQAVPPQQPLLVYYDAPCGVIAPTGALTRPVDAVTGLPLPANALFSAVGWKYVAGQSQPAVLPAAVCVEQTNALDVNGQQISLFAQAPVTDQIFITEALFDPNTGNLSVKATSSDQLFPPLLTVGKYGEVAATGQLLAPVTAPPNKVTVVSSAGGVNQRLVSTLDQTAPINSTPVARNDTAAISEDAPATAINVLANDTRAGAPIPAGAVVAIVDAPLLGAAVVNPDLTIGYTPNPNANGTDGFTYTVSVNGAVSSVALVTVNIAPVNDAPVAVADAFNVVVNVPTALGLLANDTDVDGPADLAAAVNVTDPVPAAAIAVGAGGIVNFTAPAVGTYTFTYQAQDLGGGQGAAAAALSANVATVTVQAFAAEVITVQGADFIDRQLRWGVTGSASPPMSQTLTIAYADGPNAGLVVGTTVVDAAGNWTFDAVGVAGLFNPIAAGATQVVVTGPSGGLATFPIAIN